MNTNYPLNRDVYVTAQTRLEELELYMNQTMKVLRRLEVDIVNNPKTYDMSLLPSVPNEPDLTGLTDWAKVQEVKKALNQYESDTWSFLTSAIWNGMYTGSLNQSDLPEIGEGALPPDAFVGWTMTVGTDGAGYPWWGYVADWVTGAAQVGELNPKQFLGQDLEVVALRGDEGWCDINVQMLGSGLDNGGHTNILWCFPDAPGGEINISLAWDGNGWQTASGAAADTPGVTELFTYLRANEGQDVRVFLKTA